MHGRGDPLRAPHTWSQLCKSTAASTHCCPPAEVVGLQADESVEPAADTWPAGQAVHGGLPLGPKKPALHVQAADPEGLLESEGQAVHVPFPAPLYCPAGHASHLDLSAERTCPTPQQSPVVLQPAPVHDDAPSTVWPGHAVQVAAPVALMCLPAAQAVHVAFPAQLNCPAGHVPHLDLSAERPCPAPLAQQSPVVLQPAPVHVDAPATVWPEHLRRK